MTIAVAVEEVATSITRLYRCLAAVMVAVMLAAPIAEAANLTVVVQQIDVSRYPIVQGFVSVTDSQGVPITGLDSKAFQVIEDGKPVTDFSFNPVINSNEPIAVAFILDLSGSMNDAGKLAAAKQAIDAFIDTMAPNDSAALITFSDTVSISHGYTGDKAALKKSVDGLKANGNTAIYDAVTEASQLQGAVPQRRKIMLLLTDGDDTASKQTADGAIAAAKAAAAPVFAVGLGGDVKKDVLNKIASSTGGQSVYAANGDQLKADFLHISDQLRQEYSFQYTSKLPADDKAHKVDVKATYHAETAQASGTFTAKKAPVVLDVTGITNASKVSGPQTINVAVKTGEVKKVELLVDDKSVATADAAPYVLKWDTTKETPGIHKIVIRATDATGATTDLEYAAEVVNAAASVTPTVVAVAGVATTAAQVSPTVAPVPTATTAPAGATNPLYYAIAGLVVLLLAIGGVVAFLVTRRPRAIALPTPPPAAPAPPVMSDRTEAIGLPPPPPPPPVTVAPPPASDATVVSSGGNETVVSGMPSAPRLPKGKLVVVQNGARSEVPIQQAETMLGREASNPVVVKDPMSSRRHAKIIIENGEFWVEDLKSLNGTRVNGEVITRRKLANNDQITIGDATLTLVSE